MERTADVPLMKRKTIQRTITVRKKMLKNHRSSVRLKPSNTLRSTSKAFYEHKFLWTVFLTLTLSPCCQGLRCYTDVKGTKSASVECGLNTGCVKIYIDSEEMLYRKQQEYGYGYGYQPGAGEPGSVSLPDRYLNDPVLLRGCFVLAVPDRCYMAKNGLSYCWCSQKDLCNSAMASRPVSAAAFLGPILMYLLWHGMRLR